MNAIFWGLLTGLLLLCVPAGRRHPRLVALAALIFGLNELALSLPRWYGWHLPGTQWNWTGKLLALGLTLLLIYGRRVVSPAEAGLGRPAPGSLRRVLPVVLIVTVLHFGVNFWERHPDSRTFSWETYSFQLTMPGLEEELFFRGLWLGLLLQFFPQTVPFLGTRTSWGGLIGLLLFVLTHLLTFKGPLQILPNVNFSSERALYITVLGGLFLWVRERTGSVWAAAAVHNLLNTVGYLGAELP